MLRDLAKKGKVMDVIFIDPPYCKEMIPEAMKIIEENKMLSEDGIIVTKIDSIEEIYEDKINKVIKIDDFRRVYEKKQNEKNKILAEKEKVEEELKLNKSKDIDYIKISKNFLNSAINQDKILKKIVNKIEFDSDKTVKMSLNITI